MRLLQAFYQSSIFAHVSDKPIRSQPRLPFRDMHVADNNDLLLEMIEHDHLIAEHKVQIIHVQIIDPVLAAIVRNI